MLGLPEFDRDLESRHRKYVALLRSGGRRGAGRLIALRCAGPGHARPHILAIDAAGSACSVAVTAADTPLVVHCRTMSRGQAEALLPMVDAVMREAAVPVASLDLVAATVGPGSFTGIRVGLAAAQGIALAAALPLAGVTGFEAVAACLDRGRDDDRRLLLAVLESRRAELYVQVFDLDQAVDEPAAVMPEALCAWIETRCGALPLLIAGDAAQRAAAALGGRPRTTVSAGSAAAAVGVARSALRRWREGTGFGRSEPFYLRPPDVTLARRVADAGSS